MKSGRTLKTSGMGGRSSQVREERKSDCRYEKLGARAQSAQWQRGQQKADDHLKRNWGWSKRVQVTDCMKAEAQWGGGAEKVGAEAKEIGPWRV